MRFANSVKTLLLLSALALVQPSETFAKPNSYPGESSTYKPPNPELEAKREAERLKRKELRKQKREERRLRRQNKKNRLN
ncbi:hypothetical protein [Ruegeria sp.]|uniref:hypothetical protein n=1 Tax=Ruegeria sp. TaxID=1879320 RepID=UPI002328AB16|nr:hypothetical protein [Ruegeria sp.]MDA7963429.1 hypothetical protein [Ruegeria sp.]